MRYDLLMERSAAANTSALVETSSSMRSLEFDLSKVDSDQEEDY